MNNFNSQNRLTPEILVTDLDGTFLPLEGISENKRDLVVIKSALSENKFDIIFATGRQYSSVMSAITEFDLPVPEYIICDVGTSIYRHDGNGFQIVEDYRKHLEELTDGESREIIFEEVSAIDLINPQEPSHQQEFKISYLCASEETDNAVETVNSYLKTKGYRYVCMGSIDPFQNCGMLDLLPVGVSKAYAIVWLAEYANMKRDSIVYAGDSGNDYAALIYGFKSIVVGNASEGLAERIKKALEEKSLTSHFYHAEGKATSGVLEGCRHYGLFSDK